MAQYQSSIEKKRSITPDSLPQVRRLGIAEYEQAAQTLAQAFQADEIARYFIDTPDMESHSTERKWKLHLDILRYVTAAHCYKGVVTTVGPDYDAVALWMPPGENMDDWWTILRSGMWRLYYKLSREGRARFYKEFIPLLHDTKAEILGPRDDEAWYLVYLGSKPSARGKGYARMLIEEGVARADEEGRATYLESSAEVNVSYYKKWGFEAKKRILLTRGGKKLGLDIMVREPVGAMKGA